LNISADIKIKLYYLRVLQVHKKRPTFHFMSTGKHSEEQDEISANRTRLSQDEHWITSKATKGPRGPDNAG
jgi:hypothetical protein